MNINECNWRWPLSGVTLRTLQSAEPRDAVCCLDEWEEGGTLQLHRPAEALHQLFTWIPVIIGWTFSSTWTRTAPFELNNGAVGSSPFDWITGNVKPAAFKKCCRTFHSTTYLSEPSRKQEENKSAQISFKFELGFFFLFVLAVSHDYQDWNCKILKVFLFTHNDREYIK